MGSLERVLEQDVAKKTSRRRANSLAETEGEEFEFAPEPEDEKYLEPSALTVQDALYDEDADDDLADLGFQMGKMRLTDRIGGFFRPKLAEEVLLLLSAIAPRLLLADYQSSLLPWTMPGTTTDRLRRKQLRQSPDCLTSLVVLASWRQDRLIYHPLQVFSCRATALRHH